MYTKKLVVENGASFNGKCQMTEDSTLEASKNTAINSHKNDGLLVK
jgi:cytoskeletal protein CcmA (bactofilin family)